MTGRYSRQREQTSTSKESENANFPLPASPWLGLQRQIVYCKSFVVNESSYGIARSRWGESEFVYMKFGLDKKFHVFSRSTFYFFDRQNNHVFAFLFFAFELYTYVVFFKYF